MTIYRNDETIKEKLENQKSGYEWNKNEVKEYILDYINGLSLKYKKLNDFNKKHNFKKYNRKNYKQNLDIQSDHKKIFTIIDTHQSNYADQNYPDNIIFSNDLVFENLTNDQIKLQIGLEETDVGFVFGLEKVGDPLKNIKPEKEKFYSMYNDDKPPIIIKSMKIKDFDPRINFWNDMQKNIMDAISKKNLKAKNYITYDTVLLINFSYKFVPFIIEDNKKERHLTSQSEAYDFITKFIIELENLAKVKNEKFLNLSFVVIYFSVYFDKPPYFCNITQFCFRQGIYKTLLRDENIKSRKYKIHSALSTHTEYLTEMKFPKESYM